MRALGALLAAVLLVAVEAAAPVVATADASPRERAIKRAINGQRSANGLATVRKADGLARAAGFHSRDMIAGDFFSHTSRDGTSFSSRIRRFARFSAVGENLAMLSSCRRAAARTIGMWMNSAPHRAIVLSGAYRRVGVGVKRGSYGGRRVCMVTADFGRR